MTDVEDGLRELTRRVEEQVEHIRTEAGTRQALVEPFIREVLGFDPSNVREVRPEFTADVGTKQGEKVDYAIHVDGKPLILIEVKKVGTVLAEEQPSQLYRYFNAVKDARFGIFTNGVRYLFYTDLARPNMMDELPFLELDFSETVSHQAGEITKFTKSEFNTESILASANRLKYTAAMRAELVQELATPSEELAKLFMGRVYSGVKTARRVEEFQDYIAAAASQYISDSVRDKLTAALNRNDNTSPQQPVVTETHVGDSEEDGIVTTEDEISAYYSIKSIVHGLVEQHRVTLRDQKTVCLILLDDNRRRWIARLYFNGNRYRLGLADADGNERSIDIESPDNIFDYSEDVRDSVRRLL